MIGRLRQIVPGWPFGVFVGLFVFLEGPLLYLEWKAGQRAPGLKVHPGTALLYLAAAYYGIHRAILLHPFCREDYRKWLELTPWTVYKPLPLGPIALIWEDGIVLGALMMLSLTQPTHESIRILNVFLIAHSASLTATLWPTGVGTIAYLAAFGLGMTVRFWPSPWICFAVAASVYLLVYEGLWQSLARFPWGQEWSLSDMNNLKTLSEKLLGPLNGWPYDRFFRDIKAAERFRINRIDAILVSLLVGWWVSCILSLQADPRDKIGLGRFILFVEGLLIPLFRLVIYMGLYQDSISLWGRIRTGRWIIPGYDVCLAGSLLSFMAGLVVFLLCLAFQAPLEIGPSLATTALILVALLTPPRLKQWRLTGKHRIVAGQFVQGQNADFVKVG